MNITQNQIPLNQIFLINQSKIEQWFHSKWHQHNSPIYASVDLRNSGYKLAPIDLNLFPGGFNNLDTQFVPLAVNALHSLLINRYTGVKRVLLVPENHTRNKAYLQNVYHLYHILKQAGLEVVIGSLSNEITDPVDVHLENAKTMTYYPLIREGKKIKTSSGFEPDLILLNNDLSSGKPIIFEEIAQEILPPLNAGWYIRKKSNFFTEYDIVCNEFSNLINIDPWKINPFFALCENLDFANQIGLEDLAIKVEALIKKIKVKYDEYNISNEPYAIVKADSGTYGMGIMVVKSGEEILSINRKTRNKMAIIKDNQGVNQVIIQEGVYTSEVVCGTVAEPVIYMVNGTVVGGFYRTHSTKTNSENLNSTGAKFVPLECGHCLVEVENNPKYLPNKFYSYGVIARLAKLASALEITKYV